MEKNEKIEKPAWVVCIDNLCPGARQNVGAICASTIQSLITLWHVSAELYDAVISACQDEISAKMKEIENDAESFVDSIVDDALNN